MLGLQCPRGDYCASEDHLYLLVSVFFQGKNLPMNPQALVFYNNRSLVSDQQRFGKIVCIVFMLKELTPNKQAFYRCRSLTLGQRLFCCVRVGLFPYLCLLYGCRGTTTENIWSSSCIFFNTVCPFPACCSVDPG
jgi:hypothetical protein